MSIPAGFPVLPAGAPTSLPCASNQARETFASRRVHAPKTPRHSSQASMEQGPSCPGRGDTQGRGKGDKARAPRGWHLPGARRGDARGRIPPPTAAGCSWMPEAGRGGPLRSSRALPGGREEVAAGRLWLWLWLWRGRFGSWLIRLAEPRLLPSSPHSSPIHAQQSPWVMRKRRFTLSPLHKPVQSRERETKEHPELQAKPPGIQHPYEQPEGYQVPGKASVSLLRVHTQLWQNPSPSLNS